MEEENTNMMEDTAQKSTNMTWAYLVIIVILVGGLWYYVKGYSADSMMSKMANPTPMVEKTNFMMVEEDGTKAFTLDAGSFYFNPSKIEVKKGDKVKVTITNVDVPDPSAKFPMKHDFVIDELGVESDKVEEGQSITVEFTADQAGQFEYYCSVGEHREKGMVGTLTVTE